MRLLIVEDEKRLADVLKTAFEEKKYMVDVVYDGKDGLDYAESGIYDVIILDVMLPRMNGFEVIKALRDRKIDTPTLILTAKDQLPDKLKGLDLGADDYMTKPFSTEELLMRVRVISRRKGEVVLDEMTYKDLVFNISSSMLSCKDTDKSVHLNFKESELLKLLLARPEVIISKEEIITKVWGYDSDAGDNNVEAYVSFLRRKIGFVGSRVSVISQKKLGYKLGENQC